MVKLNPNSKYFFTYEPYDGTKFTPKMLNSGREKAPPLKSTCYVSMATVLIIALIMLKKQIKIEITPAFYKIT